VYRLKDATLGSLVTAVDSKGAQHFGIRVGTQSQKDDPIQAAFVSLSVDDIGVVRATFVPAYSQAPTSSFIGDNFEVVYLLTDWALHVGPERWSADFSQCNFSQGESGKLLVDRQSRFGLAVTSVAAYLDMATWLLSAPNVGSHMSAHEWRISLPRVGTDRDWPLGKM
jgi:hypothetical protein